VTKVWIPGRRNVYEVKTIFLDRLGGLNGYNQQLPENETRVMSFTSKILLGLVLGILTGVFLGEMAAPFTIGGEVYIGLLQMTVLPYIVVSLISNIGGIPGKEGLLRMLDVLASRLP
jgi:L-cystine uptake protein TcyP (sodium:dicarboxylate symporter family)